MHLLDDHNIEQVFLYPTALGNVSRIREPEYAVALCQAYNDYVHDRYAKTSDRLRPKRSDVSDETRNKLLYENAKALYAI